MLLDEAKKVLAKAGYKMVSEQEEIKDSFRNFKKKIVTEAEDDYFGDDEYYEEFEESLHSRKYGRKLYEALSDEDYIDPSETVEGGLSDDDYIDPETNLDDEPIEDYNGEEENICPSCGEPFTGEGYEDEDGNWYCSEDCYESAMQMAADDWLDAYKDRMYGESCECGKKGCCCGGKKSKKKGKKGKSNKGWVPFWQYKKGKKDED